MRAAVFDATLALMRDEGDAFGIRQIAERAGVHETSIYRRWGSREALIVEAVRSVVREEIPIPDTGSLQKDVRIFLRRSAAFLRSPLGSSLVHGTVVKGGRIGKDARATYWPLRFAQIGVMFERAVARDEVSLHGSPVFAVELLLAPLYFRLLITRQSLNNRFIEELTTGVLRALCLSHV